MLFPVLSMEAAGEAVEVPLENGANCVIHQGRMLFLECRPPAGDAAKAYLGQFLAKGQDWRVYAGKGAIAVRFVNLNPATQRRLLLAVFPTDYVDSSGWVHTVRFSGSGDQETLWTLCEWLTGKGSHYNQIAELNHLKTMTLLSGQRILFPADMLLDVMKEPTPDRIPAVVAEPDDLVDFQIAGPEALSFVTRKGEQYATYKLKKGEALYTAVVVRFTDFRDNDDILDACKTIQKVSGIKDVRDMDPGTEILIPVTMLSAPYQPEGSAERREYEEVIQEARQLKDERVSARNLKGVVVVLDAGHGGRDHGASTVNGTYKLYEDELNYDIVCRIKRILETQTAAKVHILTRDPSQSYEPTNASRFAHDTDEVLLTHPNYSNGDATTSAHLRWYLANSIYRHELKRGTESRKMVFTSIHTDAIFNAQVRGAMIYIPGARYRRDSERPSTGSKYGHMKEVKEGATFTSTASERRRDEALSRNFADTLMDQLGEHRIKRHDRSDPIRNVIRKNRTTQYVPAVLRNNKIPTKVLVETANMCNGTDCKWLAEPWWREKFAEAYVSALRVHFDGHE
ncbi:MAG: N-acetylmuramoyl-L-alanine amidase [bacterium]|nr:N-acetylmuramoyl-L-alanine amidase [bacterium]